jgi:hypothetical protein
MYQRSGQMFDCVFWDETIKLWNIDGIDITRQLVKDVYHQFLIVPGQIRTVEDVWTGRDSSFYDEAKRLIFALAINQPGMHPMIVAFYLLALKHNCLHMFQSVETLSEYSIESLLPFDVRLIFIDVKNMVEFYNKYGTHPRLSKNFNKIKLPPDFSKP